MKLKANPFLAARSTSTAPRRVALATSAIALMAAGSVNAVPSTWAGNTDANWNTAANWSALPVSGDDLIFNAAGTAGATLNNNLTTSGFNIAGISFSGTASAYTVNGSDFTLGGNITNSSTTNAQIVNTNMALSGARTVTTTAAGGITLGGNLTGGSLTKAGAGTLALSGTSLIGYIRYSAAGTIANSGSLTLDASTTTTGTVTAATIFNNTGTLTTAGNVQIANLGTSASPVAAAFVGGNNGTFNQTAGTVNFTSVSGGFGTGFNIAFRASTGAYNLSGGTLNVLNSATQISQGGAALGTLAVSGSGTANLQGIAMTGSTTGSATINLTGGRLNIGSAGITPGTAAGTRAINLGAGTVGAFADWSTAQNMTLTNAATGVTFNTLDSVDNTTGRTITLAGILSSTGKLVKAGAGTLILSGPNTYNGGTTLNGGVLSAGSSGALGTTGTIAFGGGTLQYSASNATDYSARIASGTSTGSVSIDTNGQNVVFGTGLTATQSGGLAKTGAGTLTLAVANTYTGATNVNGGKLVVNGSLASTTTTVASGATLGGTGTLAGTTTIQSGGIHGPGNSPGVQSFTDLTYADGSIFSWEIDRAAIQTRGTGYDAVNVSGTLAGLDGADAGTATDAIFRIVIGESDFSDDFWTETRTWSDIFTAADGTTAKSGWASIFGGGFQYYSTGGSAISAPVGGSFSVSGNTLTWSAVPEPSSALAGLLLGAGLLRRRRKI